MDRGLRITLVNRRGEVHVDEIGMKAVGGPEIKNGPMGRDTIFPIASMTKPITAAATMILVEECKLRLNDPVDLDSNRNIFAHRRCAKDTHAPALSS